MKLCDMIDFKKISPISKNELLESLYNEDGHNVKETYPFEINMMIGSPLPR